MRFTKSSFDLHHEKELDWVKDFENNLEKSSTTSKNDIDYYSKINSILGNKSKYSSVDEAVEDMRKRTGLDNYLKSIASEDIFQSIPAMKLFIDNYVSERPGTSVNAVIHDLLKIKSIKDKLPNNDDVPEDVKRYINEKILEAKRDLPLQGIEDLELGKVDLTESDDLAKENNPFNNCEPNVRK
jgi:hypothetical protein